MTSFGPDETIWHYDGASATRHHPRLDWDAQGVSLIWEGGRSGPHLWSDLTPIGGTSGQSLYGLRGQAGWRLAFADSPPEDFAIHLPLPARYGRWIDRIGLWRAMALFAVIAAGVVAIALRSPAWIAPLVPLSWENKLGDAMVGDFGGRLCETPASRAALGKLQQALKGDAPVRQIAIANVPMVNAITLPGGRILIFNELIQKAQSPDELAGVLSHEIGHVRHRDTMTALVRQLGLSVILGGFDGRIGGTVNGLLSMSYSRDAERAADADAIDTLARANVSPLPTARFFDTLGKMSGGEKMERAQNWMASHPVSADRKALFETAVKKGHVYRPALEPADWAALRNACRQDPKAKKVFPFPF